MSRLSQPARLAQNGPNGKDLNNLDNFTPKDPPTSIKVIQTAAVIVTTTVGATMTFISLSDKQTPLEQCFKIALGTALLVIGGTTAFYGFRLE